MKGEKTYHKWPKEGEECILNVVGLREAKPGGFQTGVFPTFSGKVQIVSRTLARLFLVGALNRPRKRKGTNRENPRTIPEQVQKIPEKSGKIGKVPKRTKNQEPLNAPFLNGLFSSEFSRGKTAP